MLENIKMYSQKLNIFHIILISFSVHMFLIGYPNHEVLDEYHFTNFMRWFMVGIDHTPYQLPGLSFIIAPFVYLFGDNWFSWRFPIILFGMVFLYFYYKVIEHITNKKIALLTTIILSASPLIFIHSSLMLRDIPVMALGFFSLYLYFKNKYYFAAFIIGLSALIKETAIFFMIFIVLYSAIKFIKNNDITYRNFIAYVLLNDKVKSRIKKSIIFVGIISGTFLISLFIYENTINVLEYTTKFPEYKVSYEDGKRVVNQFLIQKTSIDILEKSVDDFYYISKVKDPIHHLNLFFTKGYLNSESKHVGNEFKASFLPIPLDGEIPKNVKTMYEEYEITDKYYTLHKKQFKTIWVQSDINYSYWLVGFWSIVGLISFAIYEKIRNKKVISNLSLFLMLGLVFFIPYLLLDIIRDTFVYYIIYYLPFMVLGLVLAIYKIPNKKFRLVVMISFMFAIFVNFVYYFPIKFLG